ncbi:MAG: hypothetical protein K5662_02230 [Lachnospiraceae bacterium]|nr:hypothetical protein [Lachnospiraceae bacterium]
MSEEKKSITVLRDSYDARKREERIEKASREASDLDTFAFDASAFDLSDFGSVYVEDAKRSKHFYDKEDKKENPAAKLLKMAKKNDDDSDDDDEFVSEGVRSVLRRKMADTEFDSKYDDRFEEDDGLYISDSVNSDAADYFFDDDLFDDGVTAVPERKKSREVHSETSDKATEDEQTDTANSEEVTEFDTMMLFPDGFIDLDASDDAKAADTSAKKSSGRRSYDKDVAGKISAYDAIDSGEEEYGRRRSGSGRRGRKNEEHILTIDELLKAGEDDMFINIPDAVGDAETETVAKAATGAAAIAGGVGAIVSGAALDSKAETAESVAEEDVEEAEEAVYSVGDRVKKKRKRVKKADSADYYEDQAVKAEEGDYPEGHAVKAEEGNYPESHAVKAKEGNYPEGHAVKAKEGNYPEGHAVKAEEGNYPEGHSSKKAGSTEARSAKKKSRKSEKTPKSGKNKKVAAMKAKGADASVAVNAVASKKIKGIKEKVAGGGKKMAAATKSAATTASAEYKKKSRSTQKSLIRFNKKLAKIIREMSPMDAAVAGMAFVVAVVAIATVFVVASAKINKSNMEVFNGLGSEMASLGMIGSEAIEEMSRLSFDPMEIEEAYTIAGYDEIESDVTGTVTVKLVMNSVVKDLKIKFTNAKTNKLIGGVPFAVEITDANKKTYSRTDSDKDGIIYLENMAPGDVKVKMIELADADLGKKYMLSSAIETAKVKANLDYEKIDVADEIKNENQINAAAEDTAQANVTEGTLTDTVEWVESTKRANGTKTDYKLIRLEDIVEPGKVSKLDYINVAYYRLSDFVGTAYVGNVNATAEVQTEDGENQTTEPPSEEPTPEPVPTPTPEPSEPTPTAAPEPVVTPTPTAEVVTPVVTPEVSPSPTPTPTMIPTPSVSPSPTPKYDSKSTLKTKNGEPVFKKVDGKYVQATAADYYADKRPEFYIEQTIEVDFIYTGWQEIDGNTYFFDKNGNKVTGEQVIQGARYVFDSNGVLQKGSGTLGIDVSKWNGNIDWKAVKNSGVSYVIIRCGYRGSKTGALVEDPTFKKNIKGATAAGLKVGIYFFSQAVNEVEAVEEASMTISLINGYRISYPVFLDVEDSGGRGDGIDAATRTKVINAYCQTIRNSGYTPGVYANKSWLTSKFSPGKLSGCKIWLAQYNTEPTYNGRFDMWQYSSKGSVSGISGNVDMNLSYLGY